MELELKPDFEQARRRWDAFWAGAEQDRPILQITVPRPGRKGVQRPYPARPDRDPGPQIDQLLASAAEYEYLAEAVPCYTLEFGPEHFATFLGAEMFYHPQREGTGWALPFVRDWDDCPIELKRDAVYWQRTLDFIRAFRARCDGSLLINTPVLSAGLDALAAIRGPQELLTDLMDRPDRVQRALADVRRVYGEVVVALGDALGWSERGSANWLGMYCSGLTNVIQCDFSCMIGRDMFREFALPCLEDEASRWDAVAYHLDGPQAAHHLDALCAMPGIGVIQYVPVPSETREHVESVYERALALGKGIIRGADAALVRRTWAAHRGGRLVFSLWMNSRREAEELMASF